MAPGLRRSLASTATHAYLFVEHAALRQYNLSRFEACHSPRAGMALRSSGEVLVVKERLAGGAKSQGAWKL